ncbi:MAG: sulfite exporter TauE/SafE family protein [Thermoplasmatota archaeon]
MELWVLVALAVAAVLAGFLDSIIGGGGVITLPALLATGLPPHQAIATNKVVGTGASSIATWNYTRAGLTHRWAWRLWPVAAVAAACGAALVLRIDARWVMWAVVAVVAALAIYVLAAPQFGQQDRSRFTPRTAALVSLGAIAIALYDGALGPGTGNLLLALWVAAAGLPWLQAAANGRVLNFASNVGALAFWSTTDLIDWRLGLVMAAGTVTGGWLGSRSNIRSQARWIRPLFAAVAGALILRMVLA